MSRSARGVVRLGVVLSVSVGFLFPRPGSATPQAPQAPQTASALSAPVVIEQVVLKVNGDIVTKTELEARQVDLLRQRGQMPTGEAELQRLVNELMPELLVSTVDEMLLVQRGRELGYKLTDDRFKQIVDSIRKQNNIESDEAFQAALRSENLTLADLRHRFEINLLRNQVEQQEVIARISITEDEARRYYAEHAKEFTTPAELMLREILVNVPSDGKTVNVGLEEEAKVKAEGARARALKGEAFEKVASEASDAPSKANGGLIGPLHADDLAPQLQQMLAKMKPGGISDILRSARGFYFFKLESASESTVLTFEQARDQIGNRIGDIKRDAEFGRYMGKLRTEAIIEWKSPELKKLYEKQLATAAAPKGGL